MDDFERELNQLRRTTGDLYERENAKRRRIRNELEAALDAVKSLGLFMNRAARGKGIQSLLSAWSTNEEAFARPFDEIIAVSQELIDLSRRDVHEMRDAANRMLNAADRMRYELVEPSKEIRDAAERM